MVAAIASSERSAVHDRGDVVFGGFLQPPSNGFSNDHASAIAAPKSDPVFLHVKAGMTVIVEDGSDWRMADVDTGTINWVNADLVTHIVPMA